MKPDNPNLFVVGFVGLVLAVAASVATVNMVVDPFWRHDLVNIPGFNAQRTQVAAEARLAKLGIACRLQPSQVVLGTSRVEVGIDPQHPGWGSNSGPVYNLALAGSGIRELDLTLRHVVHASGALKRVLIGLDFLMFNAHREAVVIGTEVLGYDENRLLLTQDDTCWRAFLYDVDSLLGFKGFYHALKTPKAQRTEPKGPDQNAIQWWISNYDRHGRRNHFDIFRKYASTYGDAQERYYVRKVWRPPPEQRFCFVSEGQPNTLDVFRGMVRFARASGVDVRFFINPIHARMAIALWEAGLWPQFEDWKQGLVDVLAAEARESGRAQLPLWDFSGFNSITTETETPGEGGPTVLPWYWEPSHYTVETGDLVLDRMLDYRDPRRRLPGDFGISLTEANIEAWTTTTREQLRAYERTQPAEVALVLDAVESELVAADGVGCGLDVQAARDGNAALRRGETAIAEAAFARARALHAAERERYARIGAPYRESGFERLLAAAESGEEMRPKLSNWQAYQERGIARTKQGDYRGAAEDFALAIRIGPANTTTTLHLLRGTALLQADDPIAAATDFRTALKLDPTNATLQGLLARANTASARQ
jgi:hypothetical protein